MWEHTGVWMVCKAEIRASVIHNFLGRGGKRKELWGIRATEEGDQLRSKRSNVSSCKTEGRKKREHARGRRARRPSHAAASDTHGLLWDKRRHLRCEGTLEASLCSKSLEDHNMAPKSVPSKAWQGSCASSPPSTLKMPTW